MLIDLPPGTGDMPPNLMRSVRDSKMVVVTTPQPTGAEVSARVAVMATNTGFTDPGAGSASSVTDDEGGCRCRASSIDGAHAPSLCPIAKETGFIGRFLPPFFYAGKGIFFQGRIYKCGTSFVGGLKMRIPAALRALRGYIQDAGIVRFEQSEQTVYAASDKGILLRQHKAMELLRHLDVAPHPARIQHLRHLWVMAIQHRPLVDLMPVWQDLSREGRIEKIRRVGATIGMVHSLRHVGTGDITCPRPHPVSHYIVSQIRWYHLLLSKQKGLERFPFAVATLTQDALNLWPSGGGTLIGNWLGFPPIKIWDNGLMIMDLSRARYSEPLLDLVNLRPQVIGLDDIHFFWEYFLQGYCATSELASNWKERIELLYRLKMLKALAEGREQRESMEEWQSKWWEK